uniref:Zinc finger CCCH domain-containing protein 15 n=1 Tax=Aceria tosichella TaxID=561515 RepID=A0A6G1SEY1_9ACAR
MPPPSKKPAANKESKKTQEKKKEKIVEDKTFGLKNKKGAKTQKFIQQVQKQVKGNLKANEPPKISKKEEKKKELEELNAIFRPVTTQKVEKGVDPKSVLCAFFKQGQCTKGDKCKFSHDLKVEKRAEKKSVYVDLRDEKDGGMENWDEQTLRDAVEKKHGAANKTKPPTDIICKFFIEALENNKYGWFWECPNGGKQCHYRHALPPGFVLQKDKKKAESKPVIAMEELVEVERSKLPHDLPKLTLESFLQWKKRKIAERKAQAAEQEASKKAEFKAGRHIGLSGRDMFTFNPELAQDSAYDEDEAAFDITARDDDDDTENVGEVKEIRLDDLASLAREANDDGGTKTYGKRSFQTTSDPDAGQHQDDSDGDTKKETEDVDLSALSGQDMNKLMENLDINELVDS